MAPTGLEDRRHGRFQNHRLLPFFPQDQMFIERDSAGLLAQRLLELSLSMIDTTQTVEAIGDFSTREAAEQVYTRITGLPFTGSYKADARLRMMHAGPKLLDALLAASHWIDAQIGVRRTQIQRKVQQAIAEATSGTPQGRQPIVIEVRGGVVQDVLNVPPGIDYEIRDYDSPEETAEAGRPA